MGFGGKPSCNAILGVSKFVSTTIAFHPEVCKDNPRFMAVVVLPTPPFPEIIARFVVILVHLKDNYILVSKYINVTQCFS